LLDEKYRIGRVLGAGGFGVTYLAVDQNVGLRVAIKEYMPGSDAGRGTDGYSVEAHTLDDKEAFDFGLEKFLEEAQVLARISEKDNPNIVNIHGFFKANGTAYLVMRYLEGQTLNSLLESSGGSLPENEAVEILTAMLNGLRDIHNEGFIHRDIKPQNVFITNDRGVKLIDFGAARHAQGAKSRGLTQIYTPPYAPFEQYFKQSDQGPWTDLYAVGITFYQMLTGLIPEGAPGRVQDSSLTLPHTITGGAVSKRLDAVIAKAISPAAEDRFRSVDEFLEALSKPFVNDVEPQQVPPKPPEGLDQEPVTVILGDGARKSSSQRYLNLAIYIMGAVFVVLSAVGIFLFAVGTGSEVAEVGSGSEVAEVPSSESAKGVGVEAGAATGAGVGVEAGTGAGAGTGPGTGAGAGAEAPTEAEATADAPTDAPSKASPRTEAETPAPAGTEATTGKGDPAQAKAAGALELDWVPIPGGRFQMGSNDGDPDEKPIHSVRVPAFEMSKSEVTFKQYRACVDAGHCTAPHIDDGTCWIWNGRKWDKGALPSSFQGDNQPVVCVDWEQARAFAAWAGGRLPTEAEWEYAASGVGNDWKYPWGNEDATCGRAVMCGAGKDGCGRAITWPVCSKPKGHTPQGLCDMAGNVWEWVQDWYHNSYKGAPTDGSAWESPEGSKRVRRGGLWVNVGKHVRSANRGYVSPSYSSNGVGFRIARSVP